MNNAPILIIQMQRMGDLVLSFPLLGWLARLYPEHPLWVVGERCFFEPLMPLAPKATFFDVNSLPDFSGITFHAVINLSHRREAAQLAGSVKSDSLFGSRLDNQGRLFINGEWQLYRASLTHNNRYNRYHWSDLNALDVVPTGVMRKTLWPRPRTGDRSREHGARIGLFLGASQPDKHPDVDFWVELSRLLLGRGQKPVLLGGKAEEPLGTAVAGALDIAAINLCGRFDVSSLARFISELDLLISPDTGPMHIATWVGTPVLNISLGPVNPWETGPFSPGHHIIRPALGCTGCWGCVQQELLCKKVLRPAHVALMAEALVFNQLDTVCAAFPDGVEILRSRRDRNGLYELETLPGCASSVQHFINAPSGFRESATQRSAFSCFWKAWFGTQFGIFDTDAMKNAWSELRETQPEAAEELHASSKNFLLELARDSRRGSLLADSQSPLWRRTNRILHPFTGYLQLNAQNICGAAGPDIALEKSLRLAEQLASLSL